MMLAKYVLLVTLSQPLPAVVTVGDSTIHFEDRVRSTVEFRRYVNPADCNSALISILNQGGEAECRELDEKGNLKPRRVTGDAVVINTRREPDLWIRLENR